MLRYRIVFVFLIFCIFACSDVSLSNGFYGAGYEGYVTPHVLWGRPWSKGNVRALVFVSGVPLGGKASSEYTKPGFSERDAIELVQRFDISVDTVMMCSPDSGITVPGRASYERLRGLLRNNRYDVIVLGNVSFDSLKSEIRYYILKQVQRGAGLVCVGFKPKRIFIEKNKLTEPECLIRLAGVWHSSFLHLRKGEGEAEVMRRIIDVYRLGKTRGVYVHYPIRPIALTPGMIYSRENAALYEYWNAWVGRVILWVAGRLSDIELKDGERGNEFIISNRGDKNENVDVDICYKDVLGEFIGKREKRCLSIGAGGFAKIGLKLPCVGNGRYYAEIIVRGRDGVKAFGCKVLEFRGNPKILSARSDKIFVEEGESITVRVRSEYVVGGEIRIELVDAHGRTIYRKSYSLGDGRRFANDIVGLTARLKMRDVLCVTSAMRVRVSLMSGSGKIFDRKDIRIGVTHRNQEGFKFVVWGERTDVLSYYAFKRLAERFGLKGAVSWVPEPLAANNVSQVAYVTKIVRPVKRNGKYVPFSWADNEGIDRYLRTKIDSAVWRKARGYGVMVWSLGDEPATSSVDDSMAYKRAYREYLRKRYGRIDKLNRIWKSKYRDFSEIDVLEKGDLKEESARRRGLYGRWYDRHYFMRHVFTNVFSRFKPIARKMDSKAKIGFEGAGELGKNPDIEGLVGVNDFWVTYNDVAFDIIRGLTGRDFICSKWMGYHKDAGHLISYAWDTIFRGADSLWWWRFDGIGKYNGLIKSNLEFWPQARELGDSLRILNEGLGDWLVDSDRAYDGVAIYYSHVSSAASGCKENLRFGSYAAGHEAFISLLRNLGVGYKYITANRIRKGELRSGKVKVLLLVKAHAIGDDVAKLMKDFVAGGGMIIADVLPGTFDEYCCVRREGSVLKFVFDDKRFSGRAVLLNRTIDDYIVEKTSGRGEKLRRRFYELFSRVGIRLMDFKIQNGRARGNVYFGRWRAGDVRIIGLLNSSSDVIRGNLVFDKMDIESDQKDADYVYGIDPSGDYGKIKNVRVELKAYRPVFFALSKERLLSPKLVLPEHIESGKEATISITGLSKKGKEGLFVWLEGPNGRCAFWSRRVVLSNNGRGEYRWMPAFEDVAGRWKIHVKALAGGREITGEIVKSR